MPNIATSGGGGGDGQCSLKIQDLRFIERPTDRHWHWNVPTPIKQTHTHTQIYRKPLTLSNKMIMIQKEWMNDKNNKNNWPLTIVKESNVYIYKKKIKEKQLSTLIKNNFNTWTNEKQKFQKSINTYNLRWNYRKNISFKKICLLQPKTIAKWNKKPYRKNLKNACSWFWWKFQTKRYV